MHAFKISLASLCLTTTLAAACVQQDAPEAIARAIPTAEGVRIRLPEQAALMPSDGGEHIGSSRNALLGELAQYYVVTRNVTRTLNAGAGWVLVLVHAIVNTPPTTVEGNVYTWGPGSKALDPADYRLIVTANDDNSFDWTLDGRSKIEANAEFESLIFGHAIPGEIENRGRGSFTIDFDAAERVNPIDNEPEGLVTVEYNLEDPDDGIPALQMTIDGRQLDDNGIEQDVHFEYAYDEASDGSGDFKFKINGDLDDDGSLQEEALIHSRWLPTGAGRADLRVKGGDLDTLVVEASECWSSSFGRVYYADNQDWMPSEGEESSCSHASADLPNE